MNVNDGRHHLELASRAAERAQQLLAQPATMDAYDWALVATLLVEADDELRCAQEQDASVQLPLFQRALDELREATSDFTKADFLRASRAARRQRPSLFTTGR